MSKSIKAIIMLYLLIVGFSFINKPINIEVSKRKVKTGEIFSCTIRIEGEFTSPRLTLPKFKAFNVISQSYESSTKKSETTLTITYRLFANKPGTFFIESALLKTDSQNYKTKPVSIVVKGESLKKERRIIPYIAEGVDI